MCKHISTKSRENLSRSEPPQQGWDRPAFGGFLFSMCSRSPGWGRWSLGWDRDSWSICQPWLINADEVSSNQQVLKNCLWSYQRMNSSSWTSLKRSAFLEVRDVFSSLHSSWLEKWEFTCYSFSWLHTFQLSRPFSGVGWVPLQSPWLEPPPAPPAPCRWVQDSPVLAAVTRRDEPSLPNSARCRVCWKEGLYPVIFVFLGEELGFFFGGGRGAADTRCQCRPSHCSCQRNRRLTPTSSSCDYFKNIA